MYTRTRFLAILCLVLVAAPARGSWCQWILDGLTRGGYSQRSANAAAAGFRYAMDIRNPHAARIAALHDLSETWSYYSLEYIAKYLLPNAMPALFDVEGDPAMAKAFATLVFDLTARVALFLDGRFPATSHQEAAVTETFDRLIGYALLSQEMLDPQSEAWKESKVAAQVATIAGAPLEDQVKQGAFALQAIHEARDAFVLGRLAESVLQEMKKENEGNRSPVTLALLRTCLKAIYARAERWEAEGNVPVGGFLAVIFGALLTPNEEHAAVRASNARLSKLVLHRILPFVTVTIDSDKIREEMERRFVIVGHWSRDFELVRERRFVRSGFRSLQERVFWQWLLAEPLGPMPEQFQLPD